MLMKILFCVISLVAVIEATKCYFCNDDSRYGNCEGIGWRIMDKCRFGCVTYEAKIQNKYKNSLAEEFFGRYRRGCNDQKGCDKIKKDLYDAWDDRVEVFHCEECNEDYCNNRANHPGITLSGPWVPDY
ncbi:unnamed protein product [Ceutorhynchus assimilis]|uniref:Protein quiver n=1 Tax=Ceutorhynchus assimilis TaxID=467358 RepID=A0A9N9MH35_9CUCU|nr:unnamed protein product [Ceutorhynchus assimilis]CAG9762197.1 unnamed protein product [Ceutorhynchus assimilis]CAG9762198.1 unnamed protein product [Ceutorhynchus assimilis]